MDIAGYVNKRVPFRFLGKDLEMALSHALFSSFDIDSGTKLLLKCLAASGLAAGARTAADSGCGTGIIGIALAAAFPELSVTALDRDALAVSFTEANALANGVSDRLSARGGLLLDFGAEERFDLLISNIPAKAGAPALRDFFLRAPSFLAPGGSAWVVIVNTLARQALSTILQGGSEILSMEEGPEHTVFSFRAKADAAAAPAPEGRLAPYGRGTFPFALCDIEYSIRSVYGVDDFDMPSYGLKLAARALSRLGREGLSGSAGGGTPRFLVWGPGQGHVPVILSRLAPGAGISLAGRDLLQLLASERALSDSGARAEAILHRPALSEVAGGPFDAAFVFPDLAPGIDWTAQAIPAAREILAPGGLLYVQAESAALSILDKRRPQGFRPVSDKREKGFRAMWFRKA